MPRVTINGKAPSAPKTPAAPRAASRGAPVGQSFGDTLANAIATGQQIDPTLLANSAFSQSFQSPAGQAAANRAAQDRLVAAIQAARRGSGNVAESIARAQQGLSLLRAAGATPNVNTTAAAAALDRVTRTVASRPSGGAIVPYSAAGLPELWRSASRGFSMVGGPRTPDSDSREVVRYLGRIDTSTRTSAKVETDTLRLTARAAFGSPGGLYYRTSAGGLAPAGGGRGGGAGGWPPGTGAWSGGGAGGGGLPGTGAGGGAPPGGGGGMWPPGPGPAPGGGGQGGGGGGFRRARRGYGFGKAVSRVPYVGGPLSNIIEAGALGGPIAGIVAAAVEAADFAVFNKQTIGNELSAATGRGSLFRDTQIDSFALGRAGGFSGQAIMDQIYSPVSSGITGGAFKAPDLLRRYGITAQEALADVSRFGIVQQPRIGNTAIGGRGNTVVGGGPATGAGVPDGMAEAFGGAMTSNLIRALNDPKNDPAYSGMDQNTLKRQASTMAAYGFISGDAAGVNRYFDRLRPVMIDAVTTGTDRTRMAQAIVDTMVGGARRGSVGITQENVQAGLGMFSNLAGGRTGEVGMSFGQALNAGTDMVGRSPMQSVAYMQAARQYNTPAKLAQLFGGSIPDDMKPLANDYFAAQAAGNLPVAANILAGMAHDNIPLQTALAAGQLGGLPGYMQALGMAPFAPSTSLAARREALDNYRAARGGGRGAVKPSLTTPQQGAAAQRMMSELMNGPLHLTAEQASGIVGNAWRESGLDPRASNNIAGGHAGLIQWDRGRQAAIAAHFGVSDFSRLTEMQQIQGLEWEMTDKPQGEQDSLAQLRRTNTSADAAVAFNRFNERSEGGGTESNATRIEYANRARLGGGGGGIPQEGYDQRATGGQAATASSEDSFRNVSFLLNQLDMLGKNIAKTNEIIRRSNGNPYQAGGPAYGGGLGFQGP